MTETAAAETTSTKVGRERGVAWRQSADAKQLKRLCKAMERDAIDFSGDEDDGDAAAAVVRIIADPYDRNDIQTSEVRDFWDQQCMLTDDNELPPTEAVEAFVNAATDEPEQQTA